MARLFGTDGVRGVANTELTGELAFRLGRAGAYVLTKETKHAPVFWLLWIPVSVGICWKAHWFPASALSARTQLWQG